MTPTKPDAVRWLLDVRGRALEWVARQPPQAETGAYARLMFAFGLARVGADTEARGELEVAAERLRGRGQAHEGLVSCFRHRIEEACAGRPLGLPLPESVSGPLEQLDRGTRYNVDRLRKESRILDPDRSLDPYRHRWLRLNQVEGHFAGLHLAAGLDNFRQRIEQLLCLPEAARQQLWIWRTVVRFRSLIDASLAAQVIRGCCLAEPGGVMEESEAFLEMRTLACVIRLESRLRPAPTLISHLNLARRWCLAYADFPRLQRAEVIAAAIEAMWEHCLAEEADCFLNEVSAACQAGLLSGEEEAVSHTHALLAVADGWFRMGWDRLTEPVFGHAEAVWTRDDLAVKEVTQLAGAVACAVRSAPLDTADACFKKLFAGLPPIHDTYTTSTHYGVSVLTIVEAVCLSAAEVAGRTMHE